LEDRIHKKIVKERLLKRVWNQYKTTREYTHFCNWTFDSKHYSYWLWQLPWQL